MSVKNIRDQAEVQQSAIDFVDKIKRQFDYYGEKCVLNTDQSGFKIEMYSGRTLEVKGTKKS